MNLFDRLQHLADIGDEDARLVLAREKKRRCIWEEDDPVEHGPPTINEHLSEFFGEHVLKVAEKHLYRAFDGVFRGEMERDLVLLRIPIERELYRCIGWSSSNIDQIECRWRYANELWVDFTVNGPIEQRTFTVRLSFPGIPGDSWH